MTKTVESDEDQWEAESQVASAIRNTPEFKKLVKITKRDIKANKAKIKKRVQLSAKRK